MTPQLRGMPSTTRRDRRRGFRTADVVAPEQWRKHRNTTPLRETSLAWQQVFAGLMPRVLMKYTTSFFTIGYGDSSASIRLRVRLVVDQRGQIITVSIS